MEPKGCLLGFLANLFGTGRASAAAALPRVIVNKRFVTPAEADFFRVLRAVVGMRGHVLAPGLAPATALVLARAGRPSNVAEQGRAEVDRLRRL